jgi:Fe-S protein assembly co-chaperone HscB
MLKFTRGRLGLFGRGKISFSSMTGCCKCIKCGEGLSNGIGLIKCCKCGAFQPAPPTRAETSCCPDYYRLLIPEAFEKPSFSIDPKNLKREYLKLQGEVHPDRAGALGESWSSWINRAHETLKNPLQRAIYLVNMYEKDMKGRIAEETEDIVQDSHDISLVLEVREELDATNDPKTLSRIKAENDGRIEQCCKELRDILTGGEGMNIDKAKKCINSLRYWMSIDRQLKEK